MAKSSPSSAAQAALYLRSSKDRHDVSIDAQRRELTDLAAEQGLTIVAEFSDAVESGKDENRPGLQAMMQAMKSPSRPWACLLMVDTSRLSRQPYFAQAFAHECERRGIIVRYAKVPEVDPISKVILHSVLTAMDRVHSLMSREKGLAGMAENVRKGYRAGGRAPRGYRLERVVTDTERDGTAVTKTRLEPDTNAPAIGKYLEARARGKSQPAAARDAGLQEVAQSTLIGCEWRALTYAGHTVWNQTSEKIDGKYKGGRKYRPRDEWVIHRDTHPALITDTEAEAILERLINGDHGTRVRAGRSGQSRYLLTGVLLAPDGRRWTGETDKRGHPSYRLKRQGDQPGRNIPCGDLDSMIIATIREDLADPARIRTMLQDVARTQSKQQEDPVAELRERLASINRQIDRLVDLAIAADDPAPYHRKTQTLEGERRQVANTIAEHERAQAQQAAARQMTEAQLQQLLDGVLSRLEGQDLKHAVREMVDRVELDPVSLECQIRYVIAADRLNVASPRGFEPRSPP